MMNNVEDMSGYEGSAVWLHWFDWKDLKPVPYTPDQDSYLLYRGWYIDVHLKFSQVLVFQCDFPPTLSSFSFLSSTLPSPKNMKLSYRSLSLQIDRLQGIIQSRSIMASRYISNHARSQPPCVSLHLPDYGLQVCTIMGSKCIPKLAPSRPPSASSNSLDHSLQVYL